MKSYKILLFVVILLLTYLGFAIPQKDTGEPPVNDSDRTADQINADTLNYVLESAEQGNASAQFRLGMFYLQGVGVATDYSEAARWFRKSAEQGNTSAQCMMGALYSDGLGVPKDSTQAFMWLVLSIDGSVDKQAPFIQKAKDMYGSLSETMTPQQIEEAQKRVVEWKSAHKPSPVRIGGSVLRAKLLKKVEPIYPELAMRQRISGVVIMVVTVDEEGNVEGIRVTKGHPLLAEASIEAVKQWKYAPTLLDGKPIKVIATVTTNFALSR